MVEIVAHDVLFVEDGENWGTVSPVCGVFSVEGNTVVGDNGNTYDLSEKCFRCVSYDNDMQVEIPLYEIRKVHLPAFLSVKEWRWQTVEWKYLWGAGVDASWPEQYQRALKTLSPAVVYSLAPLIKTHLTGKFRSNFRASLAQQVVKWIETPSEERKFDRPLSDRQMDTVARPHWEWDRVSSSLYRKRHMFGVQFSSI